MGMSNLRIFGLETPPASHADQGCRNDGPRPAPVQCAVINTRAGEPRDNDRTRNNRRAGSNERSRDVRRTDDDEDGENSEFAREDPSRRREQIRVSQAAWNRAREAVLGHYVMP